VRERGHARPADDEGAADAIESILTDPAPEPAAGAAACRLRRLRRARRAAEPPFDPKLLAVGPAISTRASDSHWSGRATETWDGALTQLKALAALSPTSPYDGRIGERASASRRRSACATNGSRGSPQERAARGGDRRQEGQRAGRARRERHDRLRHEQAGRHEPARGLARAGGRRARDREEGGAGRLGAVGAPYLALLSAIPKHEKLPEGRRASGARPARGRASLDPRHAARRRNRAHLRGDRGVPAAFRRRARRGSDRARARPAGRGGPAGRRAEASFDRAIRRAALEAVAAQLAVGNSSTAS
jgi:hypothetical protein